VPVPYPNTGLASDTTEGSKTVKIGGKEITLKNKSYFKTSTGDEAGCAPKKGVVTSKIRGKVYFTAWSMNVKVEGENVVRHLDLTTHNHGSSPNTGPWAFIDDQVPGLDEPCYEEFLAERRACSPPQGESPVLSVMQFNGPKTDGKLFSVTRFTENRNGGRGPMSGSPSTYPQHQPSPGSKITEGSELSCSEKCREARRCMLVKKSEDKEKCCAPTNTGDHLVEVNSFTPRGGRAGGGRLATPNPDNATNFHIFEQGSTDFSKYSDTDAPTACAMAPNKLGARNDHNAMQACREGHKRLAQKDNPTSYTWPGGEQSNMTYKQAAEAGADSHHEVTGCDPICTKRQLDAYHQNDPNGPQCQDDTPVRTEARPVNDHQFTGGRDELFDLMGG
jgi:hypothetical protein